MRNLSGYFLWIFVLIQGSINVKSASILGAQSDGQQGLIPPTNLQSPETNQLTPVNSAEQGEEVQKEGLENNEERPIIDNGGLNPNIPLSDPESQNIQTGPSLNNDINNQLASSSNVVPLENGYQLVDKSKTDYNDGLPSQYVSDGTNQYQGDVVAPVPIKPENSASNYVPPQDVIPANIPGNSITGNDFPSQTNTVNLQNSMPANQGQPLVDKVPGIQNDYQLPSNNVPVQNPLSQSESQPQSAADVDKPQVDKAPGIQNDYQLPINNVPVQNPLSQSESQLQSAADVDKPQVDKAPGIQNDYQLPINNIPVQNPLSQSKSQPQSTADADKPLTDKVPETISNDQSPNNVLPVQNPLSNSEGESADSIDTIQNQMPADNFRPLVDQAPAASSIDQSPSNYAPVQNPATGDHSPGSIVPIENPMPVNDKPLVNEVTENIEHSSTQIYTGTSQLDDDSEEKSVVQTGSYTINDYFKNTILSSSSDDEDDDEYDYYENENDDDANNGDIFDTKWWNSWDDDNDDYEDDDDDDDYDDDDYDDDYNDDDDAQESWQYWENAAKMHLTTTTTNAQLYPALTKPQTGSSTTEDTTDNSEDDEYTTEDSVGDGKGLMESVHHFDNNFGPFAGAKVSGKGKGLGGDGFAYSWTLLVAFCVILIALFIFWNRQKVEKYIVNLRQPSTGTQNKGMLYRDEDKNLLDNEYI